jgi:signal transduction histidine kinase
MPHLFERFHRIEQPRARSTEGSGIGLALVRELVRLHGGDITAESVNGPIVMTGIQSSSVDASTTNGNITYEGNLADGGRYTLTTHNGDLVLGVPENASATFTVRTYNGDFRTDLPLEGRLPPDEMHRGKRVTMTLGKGSADVTLESFGGTIRIRKGTLPRSKGRE